MPVRHRNTALVVLATILLLLTLIDARMAPVCVGLVVAVAGILLAPALSGGAQVGVQVTNVVPPSIMAAASAPPTPSNATVPRSLILAGEAAAAADEEIELSLERERLRVGAAELAKGLIRAREREAALESER